MTWGYKQHTRNCFQNSFSVGGWSNQFSVLTLRYQALSNYQSLERLNCTPRGPALEGRLTAGVFVASKSAKGFELKFDMSSKRFFFRLL